MIVPVATSHDHCSGAVEDPVSVARKTWQPHVEQKYRLEVGDVEYLVRPVTDGEDEQETGT